MNEASIPIDKARDYCLSGKAVVILVNNLTKQSFKYKIRQDKVNDKLWYVNTLTDNPETSRPYLIGTIRNEYNVYEQARTDYNFYPVREYVQQVQIFKDVFKAMWQRIARGYWKNGSNEHEIYEILHDGNCGACGRPLTDPLSISLGLGPVCRKELQLQHNENC